MPKNPHADFTPALEGYSGQGKFRFWCQMALPLTYDDSLSYYELLCKVVNYLNHTIEDVANAETNVSRLAEAYTQLQNYVNDYFDDLDVEAELRNVLDAMAEDGTLDDLLDPLVQDHLPAVVDEQIDDVVADQIDDAVAGQIDDVVAEQLPALVDEGIPDEVSDWLTENVDPVGSAVVVDSSLTISGAAADAKVTGDELADLKTQITNAENNRIDFLAFEQGGINVAGTKTDAANRVRTATKIMNPMRVDTHNSNIMIMSYVVYNAETDAFVSYNGLTNATSVDLNPASGTYVLLAFKYRNDGDIAPKDLQPDLTITNLVKDVGENKAQISLLANEADANTKALLNTVDRTSEYITGKYIDTSAPIGTTISLTPSNSPTAAYYIIECVRGDKFKITGTGGEAGRLWCFVDENNKIVAGALANASATNLELTATKNGKFISNVVTANTHSLEVTNRVEVSSLVESVEKNSEDVSALGEDVSSISGTIPVYHLTNPHYLPWRMGTFTAAGPTGYSQGMLPTDRMFTIVKVKAGSKITKKPEYTHRKRIFFGYKLSEDDATLTGYTSDAGDSITIAQDCIMYVGMLYESPTVPILFDDTILDEINFDLYVIDYKSRYSNPNTLKLPYGNPCPEIYYEGQHTDETGWDLYTSDIAEIHTALDALCTASNGYLSRVRDYGVVYTGNADNTEYSAESEWHIYEYMTRPCPPNTISLPKIAITCGIHGNEKMSVYAMYYLLYDMINNPVKNPVLSYLRSNCIITFLPMCNPYGFMKETPSRLNENGVNLNRNFPTYNWSEWEDPRTDGNGSEPGGQNYKGTSAGSETETQAVMKFFRNHYDAVLSIDLHTNGADTSSRDQISSYMPTEPQDATDLNYNILHNYIVPGIVYTNRLKPFLNEKYDAGMDSTVFWGVVDAMDYYPSCPHWVRETAGEVGQCYEVMAGSTTQFIGNQLTQYAPATIKAAAEELGNFLMTILAHCKDAK